MLRTRWLPMVAVAVGVLGLAAPARAGLLPINVTVLPEAGNYRWTYSIVIPTDQYITSGDFFTIYDFEGLVGGGAGGDGSSAIMPAGWSLSVQNWGKNPGLVNPTDNTAVPNLTFTYTGDPIYGGVGAGNFSAVTSMNLSADGVFAGRVHRSSDNKTEDSITFADVPRPSAGGGGPPTTSETPEPATLALAGLGLPALGLARLLRRKKS